MGPRAGSVYSLCMLGIYSIVFAGLAGLVFGSFLNTCATRWPKKESAIKPRSHCRSCGRTLTWWENIPLISWATLRGRCRTCNQPIGWRYPLVEFAVGALWAFAAWKIFNAAPELNYGTFSYASSVELVEGIVRMIFLWILVALAVLDAENLWLPDRLILPGIGLGLLLAVVRAMLDIFYRYGNTAAAWEHFVGTAVAIWFLSTVIAAGILLVIRFIYYWFRGQQGIGMGDVKLMAMLGSWFGAQCALLSFGIAVLIGAVVALIIVTVPPAHTGKVSWWKKKLPFGTFLCLGAVISTFWGLPVIAYYRAWAGF
jgi:leader peptidase (prepilin peptidase) / N-methyltransferase